MPLIKYYKGHLIKKTKRREDKIHVKLSDPRNGVLPIWVFVTAEDYVENTVSYYTPPKPQ